MSFFPTNFRRAAALLGAAVLAGQPLAAQTAPAAVHRAVARVELDLLKKNMRYLAHTARLADADRREQARRELVADAPAADLPAAGPDQPPLGAAARRLAAAVRAVQQTDYKHVNDLVVYRSNSLEAMQAFLQANAAAQQKVVLLLDSLETARAAFAEEFSLRQDVTRQLVGWVRVTRQVAALSEYYPRVMLPCLRVQVAVRALQTAVEGHDFPGFEKARLRLLEATRQSAAELAPVDAFMSLDLAFRDAGRAFVAEHAASAGKLTQVSALLRRATSLSASEQQTVDNGLTDYFQQTVRLGHEIDKAGQTFMDSNAPSLIP